MSRWQKIAIILAGYALAVVASCVAIALYDASFSPADSQAMSGMIAGGSMLLGIGVFFFVSLVPTGLAAWWLRANRTFWSMLTSSCVAFAAFGLFASIAFVAGRWTRGPVIDNPLVGLFAVIQTLGSPLWTMTFALLAALAPSRDFRRWLLAAVCVELVIGAIAFLHFVALQPR